MNTIFKKIMIVSLFTFLSLFFTFCSRDEKSVTNLSSPTAPIVVVIPEAKINFTHPGILHNNDDLNRIKGIVSSQMQPGYSSYEKLKNEPTASLNYQIKGPFKNIARDGVDGYTKASFESDFNAAYQNALMWVITGNELHAKKSIEIIDAYSSTLVGITGTNDNNLTASLGGFILVNAAEIMRYSYSGWSSNKIVACENMFRNVFVTELRKFYQRPAYTNGNWGTATIKAMMGISVFLNDDAYFKEAMKLFNSKGIDNGSLANYIVNEDGQCQESGRDQPHVMLGLGSLAEACEVGHHQGFDMYGSLNNRLLAGFEYTAKYNLGFTVPFVTWKDVTGKYSNWTIISETGRGQFRSVFEIAYNAFSVRKKMEMPYVKKVLNLTRPEGAPFASDNPGFGSLLFLSN
jgi:hypothetical protein